MGNLQFKMTASNIHLKKDKKIIAINLKDYLYIKKTGITNTLVNKDFSEIGFSDILKRKIYISSIPARKEILSAKSYLKKKLCKILKLDITVQLSILSLKKILFHKKEANVIITEGEHISDIYKNNLPDFLVITRDRSDQKQAVKYFLKSIKTNDIDFSKHLTVFTNLPSYEYLKLYKKYHPNRTIFLRIHDPINNGFGLTAQQVANTISQLKHDGIIQDVFSYSENDAKYLRCRYQPNAVNSILIKKVKKNFCSSLFYFIGYSNKNDNKNSRAINFEHLKSETIKAYPKIPLFYIKKLIPCEFNQFVSYSEYLQLISEAECIIDFCRKHKNEGFSYRIPESLFFNKKIITDRTNIKQYDFYDKNRVFIIGEDNNNSLKQFLETPLKPIGTPILYRYNSNYWWKEFR